MEEKIEPDLTIARLLLFAILSNSLQLKLRLTKDVDHTAFQFLKKITALTAIEEEMYFREVQSGFFSDPLKNLNLDTKITNIQGNKFVIGQLEAWDEKELQAHDLFHDFLKHWNHEPAIINMAFISNNHNQIWTNSDLVMNMLSNLYPGEIQSEQSYKTNNLLVLSKELIRDLNENSPRST